MTLGTGGTVCANTNVFPSINRSSLGGFFLCCDHRWPRHQTAARLAATYGCYQQYHPLPHYSHHTHPTAYFAIKRAEGGDFALKTRILSLLSSNNILSPIWSLPYRIKKNALKCETLNIVKGRQLSGNNYIISQLSF